MRLLLDTHALLWFWEGNPALSGTARSALESRGNECFVSHASAWEIAIKLSLGKLSLKCPHEHLQPGAVHANGWQILDSDVSHYCELLTLPPHHRDPFDRLLIAQAKAEGLTIVTSDPHFAAYEVPLLW